MYILFKTLESSIFLFFLFCFSSCLDQERKDFNVFTLLDDIVIQIDSTSLSFYEKFSDFKNDQNDMCLLFYNSFSHSLEVLNLDKGSLTNLDSLVKTGPNSIQNVDGLFYHNKDSIFIYDNNRVNLSILNPNTKEVINIKLNELESSSLIAWPIIDTYFRLYFDKNSRKILFNNHYNDNYKDSLSQVCVFDVENKTITNLKINHTLRYSETGEFGHLNYLINSRPSQSSSNINFLYSPDTYAYNYINNEIKLIELGSNTYKNLNDPNDVETSIMNVVENNIYTELNTVSDDNKVRVVWKGSDYVLGSEENQFQKKPFELHHYDKENILTDNLELENNGIAPYSWLVNGNKIYFQTNHPSYKNSKENTLEFKVVEIR